MILNIEQDIIALGRLPDVQAAILAEPVTLHEGGAKLYLGCVAIIGTEEDRALIERMENDQENVCHIALHVLKERVRREWFALRGLDSYRDQIREEVEEQQAETLAQRLNDLAAEIREEVIEDIREEIREEVIEEIRGVVADALYNI